MIVAHLLQWLAIIALLTAVGLAIIRPHSHHLVKAALAFLGATLMWYVAYFSNVH